MRFIDCGARDIGGTRTGPFSVGETDQNFTPSHRRRSCRRTKARTSFGW